MTEIDKRELAQILKDGISFKLYKRFDGSDMRYGNKVSLVFEGTEIACFYLWHEDNAGFSDIDDDFFDEKRQGQEDESEE